MLVGQRTVWLCERLALPASQKEKDVGAWDAPSQRLVGCSLL
jgi:hypothetical protein